jgi:hypothetical protein
MSGVQIGTGFPSHFHCAPGTRNYLQSARAYSTFGM